ncbi:hypothetical protein CTI12_AA070420 [Artemisia annua]|uniref:Uncharacterized protein n=1 Tax=Artemisia annua TaxID=35608 RepID=A0A2U1Q5T6_ARTAN|nr:hypothetical protein CTI12_AA070420 [Artemisia annua]
MMNNRRIRSTTYLRYLKPGALAQLRDSKMKTITHQIYLNRTITITSSPVRSPVSTQQEEDVNRSPGFTVRYNGPRCLQRKKLVAVRSICFNTNNGMISNGPEPVIDAFTNAFLVAH